LYLAIKTNRHLC